MKIVNNFPSSKKIFSEITVEIKNITPIKIEYYKNVIAYLDDHLYFNYLKATNPDFGLSFNSQAIHYVNVDVGVSLPLILYTRAFPDDEEVIDFILQIIRVNLENQIFLTLEQIRDLKENMY